MGVKPSQPPNLMVKSFPPTQNDFQNINIGTFWLVYPGEQLWFLISVAEGIATWVQLYPSGGGGGGANQFPTNFGIANEVGGVLNIFGDGIGVTTGGSGNTVMIAIAGDIAQSYVTNSGTAVPSSNVLRVLGGSNINTQGSSNLVTVNLDNSVGLTGTLTVAGTTTLAGNVVISAQTNGVLQTNGAGTVTATNGSNGQVIIGGGTAPAWANLTSDGGTVIITNGPNTINLESTGGGGGSPISFYAYQATDYSVPRPTGPGIISYPMGSANVLTVNFNNGSGFFPGDGLGTPASFTAPVSGSYYFAFNVLLRGGTIPNQNINVAFAQIVTSVTTQTYAAQISANGGGAPINYTFVQAQANTTLQLTAGDVVTFQPVVEISAGTGGTAYIVSGLRGIGSPFVPTTVTSIEGFLIQASSSGGGGGAGSIAFYAYQPTRYNVPSVFPGDYNFYDLGTAVPLTITINEGGAFYPGDGISIPASFTAPVNGLYKFHYTAALQGGLSATSSPLVLVNGGALLKTPALTYCGPTGEPSETNLGSGSDGSWFCSSGGTTRATPAIISAIVQLSVNDVVTFGTLGITASNTSSVSYTVAGLLSPTGSLSGGTSPATYVEGFLLKEL
jgi:hypothetical protein